MVEHPTSLVEWQRCPSQGTRHDHRHRCFPDRLGGCLQQSVHKGPMVSGGEATSHQPSGTPGQLIRSSVLNEGQEEHTYSSQNRQLHSPFLCQQDGGTCSI